jgi:hypothetical protein
MSDMDKKIVALASALHADISDIDKSCPKSLTALSLESVNQLEQTSLKALICWAAANCNMPEVQIAKRLSETFGARSVADLDRNYFDDAIAWLVDFSPVLN